MHYAILASILIAAAAWRILIGVRMPVMSRDGVRFCMFADAINAEGLEHLQAPASDQHPGFPLMIALASSGLNLLGLEPGPQTSQVAGQLVVMLVGLALILVCALLTQRITEQLLSAPRARLASLLAAATAALLPLNVWLSTDVMSDSLCALGVLLAVLVSSHNATFARGLLCGISAAAAYWVRPEGAVAVLGVGASFIRAAAPLRQRIAALLGVAIGFGLLAAPYMYLVGGTTSKKDPLDIFRTPPVEAAQTRFEHSPYTDPIQTARLWSSDMPGALEVLYELLRAGRLVIPLLALPVAIALHRRLLRPPLLAGLIVFGVYLALLSALVMRWGYLQPRHALVPTLLLIPFAAIALEWIADALRRSKLGVVGATLSVTGLIAPLAVYSGRVPNSADAYLLPVIAAVQRNNFAPEARLVGANTHRRVAYYAPVTWEMSIDDFLDRTQTPFVPDPERIIAELLDRKPDLLIVDLAPKDAKQRERAGNRALLTALRSDPRLTPHLIALDVISAEAPEQRGLVTQIIALDWTTAAAPDGTDQP